MGQDQFVLEGRRANGEEKRVEVFPFIVDRIRKHSDCSIALCKESASVWNKLGLPLSKCSCACQLSPVDMTSSLFMNSIKSTQ
jgi:spore photoproduct lyase